VHRSVLMNKSYIKFAALNTVEVISMEEIDRAVEKKSSHIKTYKTKDAYGDEIDYLVEFDGLTIDELKDLSSTDAILSFMEGGRIPYTAIVDPHTGEAMEAMKGKPTVASLSAAVLRARQVLTEKHGRGLPRKQWDGLAAAEVRVDLLCIAGKFVDALKAHKKAAAEFKQPPKIVKTRLVVIRESIDADVKKLLDACEKKDKLDAKARRELASLAKALGDTPLGKRAANLAKG